MKFVTMMILAFLTGLSGQAKELTEKDGGISGGGGGTTNPVLTNPEFINSTLFHDGAVVVQAWLKGTEATFSRRSPEEQAQSPLRFLFQGPRTALDLLPSIKIESRMLTPCYDAFGEEREASIYASKPGYICMSPYLMSTRVTELNVAPETLALLVHEISHLLGANEEEAVAIQQEALLSFANTNLLNVSTKAALVAKNWLPELIWDVGMHINYPKGMRVVHVERFQNKLLDLRNQFAYDYDFSFHMLRPQDDAAVTAAFVRISLMQNFVCASDTREDESVREYCRENLTKAFGTEQTITAKQYVMRVHGDKAEHLGPEYDALILQRLETSEDLGRALSSFRDYLNGVRTEIQRLKDAQFEGEVIRK